MDTASRKRFYIRPLWIVGAFLIIIVVGLVAWKAHTTQRPPQTPPPPPMELPPEVKTCLTKKFGSDYETQVERQKLSSDEVNAAINRCFEEMLTKLYPNGPPASETGTPEMQQ